MKAKSQGNRCNEKLAVLAVVGLAIGCGSEIDLGDESPDIDDSTLADDKADQSDPRFGTFIRAGATPGELASLTLRADKTFAREIALACTTAPCAPVQDSGRYRFTKSRTIKYIQFRDGQNRAIGNYAYRLTGDTLSIRKVNTTRWYDLVRLTSTGVDAGAEVAAGAPFNQTMTLTGGCTTRVERRPLIKSGWGDWATYSCPTVTATSTSSSTFVATVKINQNALDNGPRCNGPWACSVDLHIAAGPPVPRAPGICDGPWGCCDGPWTCSDGSYREITARDGLAPASGDVTKSWFFDAAGFGTHDFISVEARFGDHGFLKIERHISPTQVECDYSFKTDCAAEYRW
ncbi:MAG: hypothetical protein HYY84_13905 [Deltaproteobacteria bacterium]|nr:hypothetical protein [Deltaproteobacteria bacterium]